MEGRIIKKTGDKIFPIGLGCMRFPLKDGNIDKELAKEFIYYAIDNGINYLDTAYNYHGGESESFLGEILEGEYRQKVKISTKLPAWLVNSRESMDAFLNEQLAKLKTDCIDYYYLHSINLETLERLIDLNVFEFLNKAKKEGKIKNIGFSYHGSIDEFNQVIDSYDWDTCIVQYNYMDNNIQVGYNGIKYASSKGIGVIVMEPLKGGVLAGKMPKEAEEIFNKSNTNKSTAEWGLSWVLNHEEISCVLSGMDNINQIKENIKIANTTKANSFSDDDLATVGEVKKIMQDMMKIACTTCAYCMPCPRGVNIPECFRLYNEKYLFGDDGKSPMFSFLSQSTLNYFMVVSGILNKPAYAGLCTNCGKCTRHCPQSLDVPGELAKVSKEFEGHAFGFKVAFVRKVALPLYRRFGR